MSSTPPTPPAGSTEPIPEGHEPSVHTGMPDSKGRKINPWAWIPSVYFAQGLQYAVVIQLFGIVFFTMGVPAGQTLLWVGLLSLPWTLKPLWGPLVDRYWTKRSWTFWMQLLVGLGFLGTAIALQTPYFFALSIVFLLFMAFAAATHDIACDGYYMLGLREKQQAFFVGVRSTCFRIALIFVNGALLWVAGMVVNATSLEPVEFTAQSVIVEQVENGEADANGEEASLADLGSETATNPIARAEELAAAATEQSIILTPEEIRVEPGEETEFFVRLSQDPGEGNTRTVIIGRTAGDQSLTIPRDSQRFEFNSENWNIPQTGVVGADARLTEVVTTSFEATAGNIALSWAVAVGICAAIFLFVGIYHRFILPYPGTDAPDTVDRPPFYVPLFALGFTVGVPALAAWLSFIGMGWTSDLWMKNTIGIPAERVLTEQLVEQGYGEEALERRVTLVLDMAEQVRDGEMDAEAARLEAEVPVEVMLRAVDNPDREVVETHLRDTGYPSTATARRASALVEIGERALEEDVDRQALAEEEGVPLAQVNFAAQAVLDGPEELEVQGFTFFFAVGRLLLIGLIATLILRVAALRRPVASAFYRMSEVSRIGFADVFVSFFTKGNMAVVVGFLLTFRLGEAQLAQVKNLFLVDIRDNNGLALTLGQMAFTNGVVYLVALTIGGLLGGFIIAKYGLKATIWYMVAAMHLPNLLYVWLTWAQPESFFWVNMVVGLESFGYGLGFTAYLLVMILAAQGPYKTAHYALCTGFMALGFMIPGMWSGYLAELTGYFAFFIMVMIFTLPGVILIPFLKIDPNFGRGGR